MKRFFTKKSVALIITTAMLVSFGFAEIAFALLDCNAPRFPYNENPPPIISSSNSSEQNRTNKLVAEQSGLNNKILNIQCKAQLANKELSPAETAEIAKIKAQTTQLADAIRAFGESTQNGALFNIFDKLNNIAASMLDLSKNIFLAAIPVLLENIIIPISAFLLAIAGKIMDFSVQYSISAKGFTEMSRGISDVWVLVRDTLNIFFIFILLYAAIQQIIFGSSKKEILVKVITAAVLINFSLFATRIIIDASNLVAVSIYNQITKVTNVANNAGTEALDLLTSTGGVSVNSITTEVDLSGRLMDSLRLTTSFNISGGGITFKPESVMGINGILLSVIRIILFLITTYVFMFIAAVLAGRFVMLVLLMATSPVAFLAGIGIPRLEEYSKNWWDSLINQSLLGPAFMFLMLLTITLAEGLPKDGDSMIIFFNFFLVVYLLLKSVSILKGMSGSIGKFAEKFAAKTTGLALGTVASIPAFAMRQTVGKSAAKALAGQRGAQLLADSKSENFTTRMKAKAELAGLEKRASSTFDIRNTGAVKSVLEHAKDISGTDIVDSESLKPSGVYEEGTGYAGMVKTESEATSKEAKDAEKANKEYEQRIVDRNPAILERYKNIKDNEIQGHEKKIKEKEDEIKTLDVEKTKLNEKLKAETDEKKKNEIRDDIRIISEKKEAAQTEKNNIKEVRDAAKEERKELRPSEVIKSHNEGFGTAEAKVKTFEEKEKKIEEQKKQNEDRLAELNKKLEGATEEEQAIIKEESTLLSNALANMKKEREDYTSAKNIVGLGKISESPLKNIRETIAKRARKVGFSLFGLSDKEKQEMASRIRREAPQAKSDKEKEAENIAKALKSLQDKEKKEKVEENKTEEKPK